MIIREGIKKTLLFRGHAPYQGGGQSLGDISPKKSICFIDALPKLVHIDSWEEKICCFLCPDVLLGYLDFYSFHLIIIFSNVLSTAAKKRHGNKVCVWWSD